jgi:hypothetical protein
VTENVKEEKREKLRCKILAIDEADQKKYASYPYKTIKVWLEYNSP